MIHRTLGRTGLRVPVVSFGAGPVSGLMTGDDADAQRATVARASRPGSTGSTPHPGTGRGGRKRTSAAS